MDRLALIEAFLAEAKAAGNTVFAMSRTDTEALISALRESQARAERYRVALERVAEFPRRYTESLSTGTRYYHESECEIARAALGGG